MGSYIPNKIIIRKFADFRGNSLSLLVITCSPCFQELVATGAALRCQTYDATRSRSFRNCRNIDSALINESLELLWMTSCTSNSH